MHREGVLEHLHGQEQSHLHRLNMKDSKLKITSCTHTRCRSECIRMCNACMCVCMHAMCAEMYVCAHMYICVYSCIYGCIVA